MIALDKKSQIPLYEQLKAELVRLIQSGKFKDGRHFYSLSEIAGQYQVSLITVRRVMSEMAAEGYVKIIPGKRALVNGRPAPEIIKIAVFFYSPAADGKIEYETMPWTNLIYAGMLEYFMEKNILCTTVPVQTARNAMTRLEQIREDHKAFVFLSPSIGDSLVDDLMKMKIPFLIVQPNGLNRGFNYIAADHFSGSAEIAEIAVRKNYRSFLYVSRNYVDTVEKLRGFQETLLRFGISPERIHLLSAGDIDQEAGSAAFERFLAEKHGDEIFPLAVYASGDRLALGVLSSCRKLGLKVPGQIGVAGGTGIPEAAQSTPPLTTMEIPMHQMGREAAKMSHKISLHDQSFYPGKILKVILHERQSL